MQQTIHDKFHDEIAPQLVSRGLVRSTARSFALSGGRTNHLWRIARAEGDIVVKLFSGPTQNPLFPNDPTSEVTALRYLEGQGVAPQLVDHFQIQSESCLVYDHVPGTPWHRGACAVAKLLYHLHRIAPPKGLHHVADGSQALTQHTRVILSACSGDRRQLLDEFEPTGHVPRSGKSCFLHGDPVPANIIQHATSIRLIDWQCPAIGDPCEDLSVFLSPAMQLTYRGETLNSQEVSEFLSAYPDQGTVARYRQLAPWYHWRMAAYCLWQECRGDLNAARAGAAELDALRVAITV